MYCFQIQILMCDCSFVLLGSMPTQQNKTIRTHYYFVYSIYLFCINLPVLQLLLLDAGIGTVIWQEEKFESSRHEHEAKVNLISFGSKRIFFAIFWVSDNIILWFVVSFRYYSKLEYSNNIFSNWTRLDHIIQIHVNQPTIRIINDDIKDIVVS